MRSFGAIESYLETDFVGPNGATTLRLRKAWVNFKGLRIGQETSTFGVQQGSAPTTADFDGPPTGVTIRSGMIRYRKKFESGLQLMASLETPKVDVAYLDFFAPDIRATDQRLPDLAVNASKAGDWGYISLVRAGAGDPLPHDDERSERGGVGGGVRRQPGGRLSAVQVGGEGRRPLLPAHRRPGAGPIPGLALGAERGCRSPTPRAGTLNAVPAFGGYVAYERRWTPQFFSTLIGGGNILKMRSRRRWQIRLKTSWSCSTASTSPFTTMKIGGEVDWGRKHTFTEIEAEALRYYLVIHYDL